MINLLVGVSIPLLALLVNVDEPPPVQQEIADEEAIPPEVEEILADSTVRLLPSGCAGAVVGDGWYVATVAHCVRSQKIRVQIGGSPDAPRGRRQTIPTKGGSAAPPERETTNRAGVVPVLGLGIYAPTARKVAAQADEGLRISAEVVHRDPENDRVLLRLAERAPTQALPLAAHAAQTGDRLYFGGHHRGPGRFRALTVQRVAPCPTLPNTRALHTDLNARKGDSGSPLINDAGELVGMVHGGARCQIATPTHGLDEVLATLPAPDGRVAPAATDEK